MFATLESVFLFTLSFYFNTTQLGLLVDYIFNDESVRTRVLSWCKHLLVVEIIGVLFQ